MNYATELEKLIINFIIDRPIKYIDWDYEYEPFTSGHEEKETNKKSGRKVFRLYKKRKPSSIIEHGNFSVSLINVLNFLFEYFDNLKSWGIEIQINNHNQISEILLLKNDFNKKVDMQFVIREFEFILNKVPRFLNQLEKDLYIDKFQISDNHNFIDKKIRINCGPEAKKHSIIENDLLFKELYESLNLLYSPNYRLVEFKQNSYISKDILLANKEFEIAKINTGLAGKNINIARIGIVISIISIIISIGAVYLAYHSLGIPATVKIDEEQLDNVLEKVENNRKVKLERLENKMDSVFPIQPIKEKSTDSSK